MGMSNVEYSVEPHGHIALHAERNAELTKLAARRGWRLDELTRRAAYECKAELEEMLPFPLRVRGSAAG